LEIDFNRGLTRLYVLLWAMWLGYWLLRIPRALVFDGAPHALIRVGIVGILFPGLLLLALRWVWAGFRPSQGAGP